MADNFKSYNSIILPPTLSEIVNQLEVWAGAPGLHAAETRLYWAQKLHHQATIALSAAQDGMAEVSEKDRSEGST